MTNSIDEEEVKQLSQLMYDLRGICGLDATMEFFWIVFEEEFKKEYKEFDNERLNNTVSRALNKVRAAAEYKLKV